LRKSGPKCKPAKPHIFTKWGAIPPEQKPFLLESLGPKSAWVRWRTKAPQGGELDKVPHPKKFELNFLEKIDDFFLNFRHQRDPQLL